MPSVRVIGWGRAGGSIGTALEQVGWRVVRHERSATARDAAQGVDLCLIATPDGNIAEVASLIEPGTAVIGHLAGSLGLDVLDGHAPVCAIHPLVSLPDADTGARLLRDNAWFATAGDDIAAEVVRSLGGRSFEIADEHRALYHAAAAISSNHTVALLGQVARVAAAAGVPFEAFVPLVQGSVANAAALGPARALTGPVSRGDEVTIERHRSALDELGGAERDLYDALVAAARRLL